MNTIRPIEEEDAFLSLYDMRPRSYAECCMEEYALVLQARCARKLGRGVAWSVLLQEELAN